MPKEIPDLVKGVIYARYSYSGQREESIEGQIRECREYAEKYNIVIVGEYSDRAISGTSDKRPEFQRMIRDSAKGQFSVVICWKNDRFARSRYDSAIYKYKLKQNGVQILYAKEAIPQGPEGIVLESIMEGFAEYYSANLSQNVKRGNYESALKRQTLGLSVFGLRKGPDKRFEIDPATAPIVRRIFEEYAGGKSSTDICADLNAEGYRTSKGTPFTKTGLRYILKNEKYVGIYRYADIVDPEGIPAIVDQKLFDKVQQMLDTHHRAPNHKITDGGFLLTTKLFCGECGEPMTGDSATSNSGAVHYYYTCVNRKQNHKCAMLRLYKEKTEDLVIDLLLKALNDDTLIETFADKLMEWQLKEQEKDTLSDLKSKLKKNETALKNSMSMVDSGLISEALKSHIMDLESERADLQAAIAREQIKIPMFNRKTVTWYLKRLRDTDKDNPSYKSSIIEAFLYRAYFYADGSIILYLNFTGGDDGRYKITAKGAEKAIEKGEEIGSGFISFVRFWSSQARHHRRTPFGVLFLIYRVGKYVCFTPSFPSKWQRIWSRVLEWLHRIPTRGKLFFTPLTSPLYGNFMR